MLPSSSLFGNILPPWPLAGIRVLVCGLCSSRSTPLCRRWPRERGGLCGFPAVTSARSMPGSEAPSGNDCGDCARISSCNSLLTAGFPLSAERVYCVTHGIVYLSLRSSLCLTVITQTHVKSSRIRIPLFFSSFLAAGESTSSLGPRKPALSSGHPLWPPTCQPGFKSFCLEWSRGILRRFVICE